MATVASAQELVTNGSFEMPPIGTGYITVFSGQTTVFGWSVGRDSVDIVSSIFQPTYPARDGDQLIDLQGVGPGLIEQTLATVAGQTYDIHFSGSSNTDGHEMQFFWDGALQATLINPGQGTWQDYEYFLTATGSNTVIGFGSQSAPNPAQGALIDSVSVQAVPEPIGVASLALGLSGLILRRRKLSSR